MPPLLSSFPRASVRNSEGCFPFHVEWINGLKPFGTLKGPHMIFKPRTEPSDPCMKKTSATQNGLRTSRVPEIQEAHDVPVDTWCSLYLHVSLQRWRALGGADCCPKKGWSYLCVHSLRSSENHWRLMSISCSLQDRLVHQSQTGPFALDLRA